MLPKNTFCGKLLSGSTKLEPWCPKVKNSIVVLRLDRPRNGQHALAQQVDALLNGDTDEIEHITWLTSLRVDPNVLAWW